MNLAVGMITFDCSDPDALGSWWSQAVDGTVTPVAPGEFVMVSREAGPRLGFQRVDEPTSGKNRVHVDFTAPDVDAEVARLVALGATERDRHDMGGGFRWVVLTDPAGNAFCVGAGG